MTIRVSRGAALRIGCAAALAAAVRPSPSDAQLTPVRFAASPAGSQAEAYFAQQLGFFQQAGISMTQTFVTRGPDSVAGVLSGDFDIGSLTPGAMGNAIIRGIPIRVVATGAIYLQDPATFGLFVAKDSPIQTARDLETATIALQDLSDSQSLGVLAWLDQNRLDPTKVKFIEMPFGTMSTALARNQVSAAFLVEPYIARSKDAIRLIPRVYASLGTRLALGVWFARSDYIGKNPTLVRSIANALYATARQVNANQESVDNLLVSYSKVDIATAQSMVKQTWAESTEPANFEPQFRLAVKYKQMPRMVTFAEMMGLRGR
jgi:NitT/TauT family transport system substrate-binding protein